MIPVCEPFLNGNEKKYLEQCIESGWLSSRGKFIQAFEEGFAKFCECKYGVATTSGTTALHLALVSLGITKGDEVIIPTFTMIATAFAVIYTGAKPVLVDVQPTTWCIEPHSIEKKITKRTKAIIVVHIYGHPCDMEPIVKIARKNKLFVIEDAAQAHGAKYKGKPVGSFGDIACFSFYANKIITTGEGGMVVTNNKKLYERARKLCNLAFGKVRFLHHHIGYNYRITNLQAAIGLAQLEKIDQYIARRRNNAYCYNRYLSSIKGIKLPPEMPWAYNVYWMYGILVTASYGKNRKDLQKFLLENGVETREFFIPMHRQPVFHKLGLFKKEKYPVADELSKRGFYLPSSSNLREKEIKYVSSLIKRFREY